MDYTTIERTPFKAIGARRATPYGGGTWAIVKGDDSNEAIKKLSGHFYDLGLDSFEYPSTTGLKFQARGTLTGQTLASVWKRINNEFLPQSKYKKSGLPTIEKYVSWDEKADKCSVEIWIPISLK